MDEPTAALGVKESRRVLDLILDVKRRGLPIVLISHNMPHVFEVADRIHIHRLGRRICVIDPKDYTMSDAVAIMTGAMKPPAGGDGRVSLDALAADIRARAEGRRALRLRHRRPAGAGKSTLRRGARSPRSMPSSPGEAALLPMDGYHFDNAMLDERGLLPRKGAPQTFDVDGLARDLERIRAGGPRGHVPVFDRNLDLARAGARAIRPEHRVIADRGQLPPARPAALERARPLLRPHALSRRRPGGAAPAARRPLAVARPRPRSRPRSRGGERPRQRRPRQRLRPPGRHPVAGRVVKVLNE